MPTSSQFRRTKFARKGAAIACVVTLAQFGTSLAMAQDGTNGARDLATPNLAREARRVEAQLTEHGEQLSIAVEDYNSASIERDVAQSNLEAARGEAEDARAAWEVSKEQVARRAREVYLNPFHFLEPLVEARGISQFLRSLAFIQRVLENDQQVTLKADKTRYESEQAAESVEESASTARERADAALGARELAASRFEEQRALLNSVDAQVVALIEAESEESNGGVGSTEIDEPRSIATHAPVGNQPTPIATNAIRVTPRPIQGPGATQHPPEQTATPRPQQTPPTVTQAGPPKAGAAKAVSTAAEQIGKPYEWGGSGPNTFDCSGLTAYAWKAAGVSLPHSSRSQYSSLPKVAKADLKPGDLVFFGNPIHHVGIYEGGGMMIAAPQTGQTVRRQSISRSDYTGSARP